MKTGKVGYREARRVAERVEPKKKGERWPGVAAFTTRLSGQLLKILDKEDDVRVAEIEELISNRRYLPEGSRREIVLTLEKIAERATRYAERIGGRKLSK